MPESKRPRNVHGETSLGQVAGDQRRKYSLNFGLDASASGPPTPQEWMEQLGRGKGGKAAGKGKAAPARLAGEDFIPRRLVTRNREAFATKALVGQGDNWRRHANWLGYNIFTTANGPNVGPGTYDPGGSIQNDSAGSVNPRRVRSGSAASAEAGRDQRARLPSWAASGGA